MHRRGVAWLLAVAALFACPGAAYGSIDAALKTFDGAWPQGCGPVTIQKGSDPDPTVSGYATFGTCEIYLTESFLRESPAPETLCAVVVHEFGHLLGLDHSADEGNVMFPSPLPPPACLEEARSDTPAVSPELARIASVDSVVGSAQPTTGDELLTGSSTRGKRRSSRRSRVCARASTRSARAKASSRKSSRTRRRACRTTA